jgi:hypothetical protein
MDTSRADFNIKNRLTKIAQQVSGAQAKLYIENHLLFGKLRKLDKNLTKGYNGTKKRHQHPVGLPGLTRKHQQFVPDMWRAKPYANDKINSLLALGKGRYVCSPSDIKYVKSEFGVTDLLPSNIKKLGNTGISLYYDTQLKKFVLEK